MKKTILIIFATITIQANPSSGQKKNEPQSKLTLVQEQLTENKNQILALQKSNEELKEELKHKEELFKLYEILLTKYENSRSSLISEFSILIAVLTLIFGFVGYFTALKPAQESKKEVDRLLEKLQTNIDGLFSEYLEKNRNKLINRYLTTLLNNNESEISHAIHYLNSVKHQGFDSGQLFKMRKIVVEQASNQATQVFIYMTFTKDEIVENTCVELFHKNMHDLISYALIYFAQHEIHTHDELVIAYLNKNPDEWASNMASIRTSSEDYLITLWDQHFTQLNEESLSKISSTLNFYKSQYMNKGKTAADFIEKVKKSKFGQAKKEEELKQLFMVFKPLF